MAQSLVARAQCFLCRLLLCHVEQRADEATFLARPHLAEPYRNRECRSILAAGNDFASADPDDLAFAGFEVIANVARMLLAVGRRHEPGDRLSHDLGLGKAKHTFRRLVEALNFALFVDGNHAVRDILQNVADALPALAQRLPRRHQLRDIGGQGEEGFDRTVDDMWHIGHGKIYIATSFSGQRVFEIYRLAG